MEALKVELSDIMAPVGLRFEWRSLEDPREVGVVCVDLVVVTFKGTCAAEQPPRSGLGKGALGWTYISNGEILPFSDIDCDHIRKFIYPLARGRNANGRNRLLGRAAARVLAHELYHIVAHTTHHATRGLAEGFYTAAELVSDTFRFQGDEFRPLHNLRMALRPSNGAEPASPGK